MKWKNIQPREIAEPIHPASSNVSFPLASGVLSDRRTSIDGDIQPTEHPWANTTMFAEIFERISFDF